MIRVLSREILTSLRLVLVVAAIGGVLYPLAMTGIAQATFHDQANGELTTRHGQIVGAHLIGQNFTSDAYFQGRPSATIDENNASKAKPYNAANSGGDNLAPSNKALVDAVRQRVSDIRKSNPTFTGDVPVDLVTTDFSGFDPDITEASALLQVNRVARARLRPASDVRQLVLDEVEGRSFGLFGEPHVNVLAINLALDDDALGGVTLTDSRPSVTH